jgi:hypothetical protein
LPHKVRDDAEQADHGAVVAGFEGEIHFRETMQAWIKGARAVGDAGGRHPAGSAQRETVGMEIAGARIARQAEAASELEGVRPFRPGKIIREIVDRKLEVLAVGDALV